MAPGEGVLMLAVMTRPGRLLIVDDDEGVTQTFAGILRLEGLQVRTAMNAQDGLREAETFRPDAIILDLRMPLVNGLGFLYRLRERHERIPVTIITGDATLSEEALTEIADLGADVCFKPIWTEDLQDLAERLLARTA
jgi:DNA-binding NtrC family response regulator